MILRNKDKERLERLISQFPVTGLLGARQTGKSTLARSMPYSHFFDLENPRDLQKLSEPQLLLEKLEGLIVIDEIQRIPNLFQLIRYLVDCNPNQRYLILGSASPDLIRQSSESLAGRIGYHILDGFSLADVQYQMDALWLKGGFPRAFISSEENSFTWRKNFLMTYLERDLPQLGITIPSATIHRFWTMLCHYHGQLLNASELSRSFGISDFMVRRYLEILEGTYMIRLLQPWYSNVGKRIVKSPKIYIKDSGILHQLMEIHNADQLLGWNKLGASWEGFAMEQTIGILQKEQNEIYFWRTHSGAELDLLWFSGGHSYGIEFKYGDAPGMTKSLTSSFQDLKLSKAWIVYPGDRSYSLTNYISVVPLRQVGEILNDIS
ncbi:MAG: ATP-binding protein [Bacteroidales bacterium]